MSYRRIKLKDIKQSNCVKYTKTRKELADNFIIEGYKPKKGIITIGIDNKIINGNHRYCLLLQKYGKEYVIVVRKIPITHGILYLIATSISIILLPIIFPFKIVKEYYDETKSETRQIL